MKISKRSKITSSKETADRKTDRRISPTNVRYKGYMIRLDRGGDGYNVYDKHGELEDAGYGSIEKAKEFVDELENEAKRSYVRSSIDEDSNWRELQSKSVLDSDGFYTDYTLYTNGSTFICMFGDKDIYEPDEAYADYETENEEEAYSWFDNYEGFADEDDLIFIDNRKSSIVNNDPSLDPGFDEYDVYSSEDLEKNADSDDALWDVIDDEEFEFRGVQDVGYDDDGSILVVFNNSIREDMVETTAEDLLAAFRKYGYSVNEWDTNGSNVFILSGGSILSSTSEDFEDHEDDIQEISQEFTSENTSINSTKLPAVFKMVSFEPGTTNIDYGGGRFDNVADYLTQYDVINLVYDPYNRTPEHNKEVIRTLRRAGGADTATCSNVLNVIKEPEVRKNVLENISKIVKPGGKVYITVYEGSGKGDEGPTKSGYQLNRKTADYLEEIQEVFPDAKRKGKLIVATNKGSVNSSSSIKASSEIIWDDLDWNQQIQVMKRYIRNYKGTRIFEDFADHINKPVEDIIDSFADAEANGDIKIPERKQIDSEYRNDDIYSSTTSSSRYWYFTRHGVQPGSVPKYVNILDIVDKPEGSYFLADGVILTKDLRDYEIKERKPEDSVTSSTRIEYSDILEEIREQCNTKLIHIMAQYGFDESEAKQYSRVDASIEDNQYGRIEIGCELDYDGLMRVCQELDPIVQAYDPDSYFEPVDPGIAEAWINLEKAPIDSSSNIQADAYDFPEPSLDPPEYPEPEDLGNYKQSIDLDLDAVIDIDQIGSWDYEDKNYTWARCKSTKDGSWYSDEYNVFIGNPEDIVERVDDLLISKLPEKEGQYRISGKVHLEFEIRNVSKYTYAIGPDDYDEEIDTDNADVYFDFYNSNISDFRLRKIQ